MEEDGCDPPHLAPSLELLHRDEKYTLRVVYESTLHSPMEIVHAMHENRDFNSFSLSIPVYVSRLLSLTNGGSNALLVFFTHARTLSIKS